MAELKLLAISKALVFMARAVCVLGRTERRSNGCDAGGASREAHSLVNEALDSLTSVCGEDLRGACPIENALANARSHLAVLAGNEGNASYHIRFALRNLETARRLAQAELRRAVLEDGPSSVPAFELCPE